MKKNNFLKGLLMLMMVFLTSVSALAQEMKLSAEKAFLAPGETASVVVSLKNDLPVSLVTGYIQLPEGLSFVKTTGDDPELVYLKSALVGRCEKEKSFILNFVQTTYDDHRAYFNYDMMKGLAAGSGDIFSFEVVASKDLAISNTVNFEKVNISPKDITIDIFGPSTVSTMVCNSEYKVDFSVSPIKIVKGQASKVAISLGFDKDVLAGLQFDLVLPEGLKVVENSPVVVEDRCPAHYANLAKNGHFVVMSARPHDFVGTSGELCSFEVEADEKFVDGSVIEFNNIRAVTGGAYNVPSVPYFAPNLKVKVTKDTATGINNIESDFASKADGIYTISGLKVDKLVKGINIVVKDGKATKVVKK